jgi:UPF0271 protein
MDRDELGAAIVYQVGAVAALCQAAGGELRHVKPHGALYNKAALDAATAETIARAVRSFSAGLVLVGLAGSVSLDAGRAAGLAVAAEGFVDRTYEPDGSLRSRRHADALITDRERAAERAVALAMRTPIEAIDGTTIDIAADTLCLHGDTPGAPDLARAVRAALDDAGIAVAPPPRA